MVAVERNVIKRFEKALVKGLPRRTDIFSRAIPADIPDPRRRRVTEKITFQPDHEKLKARDETEWARWHSELTSSLLEDATRRLGGDHELAEEIVQQAWVSISIAITRIQDSNLNGYLYRAVQNKIIDYYKSSKRRKETPVEEDIMTRQLPPVDHVEDTLTEQEDRQEAVQLVADILERLSPVQREQMEFVLQGSSLEEIAEMTGVSVQTIKWRRYQAMQTVRKMLEVAHNPEEAEKEKREENWLRTIANVSYPVAIRLLAIEEGLRQKDFFQAANIIEKTFVHHRGRTFSLATLNNIFSSVDLAPQGKAAQLMRLKSMDTDALSLDELEQSSGGELARYIRILFGFSQRDMTKKTGIAQDVIGKIERSKNFAAMKRYFGPFIASLDLTVEEPLVAILQKKVEGEEVHVSSEEFQNLSEQKLLVRGEFMREPKLSVKDTLLINKIRKGAVTFGQALGIVLKDKKLSYQKIGEIMDPPASSQVVSRWVKNDDIPYDSTIARLGIALGYTVHHPILWEFFRLMDQDQE